MPFQFYNEEFMSAFIELHRVEHDLKDKARATSELDKAYPMLLNLPDTLLPKNESGRIDFSQIRKMDIYDDNYGRWDLSYEDKNLLQGMKIAID